MPRGRQAPHLEGMTFHRLTVLERDLSRPRGNGHQSYWVCRCICGQTLSVGASQLKNGSAKSCGCYSHDLFKERVTKHGGHGTPEYFVWKDIRKRCTATKGRNYRSYAARGITLCERWRDFAAFLGDMGPRPSPKHSIERIDNDRGYEPSNCRWATQSEQMLNSRRTRPPITYKGKTQPLMAWAAELGLSYYVLHGRIYRRGWSVERAFYTPTLSP